MQGRADGTWKMLTDLWAHEAGRLPGPFPTSDPPAMGLGIHMLKVPLVTLTDPRVWGARWRVWFRGSCDQCPDASTAKTWVWGQIPHLPRSTAVRESFSWSLIRKLGMTTYPHSAVKRGKEENACQVLHKLQESHQCWAQLHFSLLGCRLPEPSDTGRQRKMTSDRSPGAWGAGQATQSHRSQLWEGPCQSSHPQSPLGSQYQEPGPSH